MQEEEKKKRVPRATVLEKAIASKGLEKHVVISVFDMSFQSDSERDEDRLGQYYIKNARYYPIQQDDYSHLHDSGHIQAELRKGRPGIYMRELHLAYDRDAEGVFIQFIDDEGIDYLKRRGYTVQIDD